MEIRLANLDGSNELLVCQHLDANMSNQQDIFLFGLNHRVATVEIREKLAFKSAETVKALTLLKKQPGIKEGLILSTCNRTEIYVAADTSQEMVKMTLQDFLRQVGRKVENFSQFYFFDEERAVRHLFRVAAGLDSMILGEPQVLGQVKDAYHFAVECDAIHTILDRLFNYAFVAGKKVRTQTDLGEGAITVAHAAVELAQKIFSNLYEHRALLIGAGEMSELVATHLQEKGVSALYIANRTFEKAEHLAQRFNGKAVPFADILSILKEVDIAIGATSAKEFILTQEAVAQVVQRSSPHPLFLIDISVPRNFDPRINNLDNVFLHDIDALGQIVEKNLAKRRQAVPEAEKIIEAELYQFLKWHNSLEVTPTIIALRKRLEDICETELKKYQSRMDDKEFQAMSIIARTIVHKILHTPTLWLKEYNHNGYDRDLRLNIIRELFGLPEKDMEQKQEEASKK